MKFRRSKQYDNKKMKYGYIAGYLGIKKFDRLFFAAMFEGVQMVIMGVIDKLIIGNLFGKEAMAGIVLLGPLDDICSLFQIMFTAGAAIVYSQAIAEYDIERARKIEGMSIFLTMLTSVILFLTVTLVEKSYFDIMEAEGSARTFAEQYFIYSKFFFLLTPLSTLLGEFIIVDGNEKIVIMTMFGEIIGNVFLSFALCLTIGIRGASLGSMIGILLCLCILLQHFFRRSNKLKPKFFFSLEETLRILKIGASDSVSILFDSIYDFFIRVWFISHFGIKMIPALAAVVAVSDLFYLGDSVGSAVNTMMLSYCGEGNKNAAQNLLIHAVKASILFATAFIGVVYVAADAIPFILGIRHSELNPVAALGCRLRSIEIIPYMIIVILVNYYISIEKYSIAVFANAMKALLIRIPMVVIFSNILGMEGVWLGSGLTSYITLAVLILYIVLRYGRNNFPFIGLDFRKKTININFRINEDDAAIASEKLEQFLQSNGIDKSNEVQATMALEEISMLILETNRGKMQADKDIHIDTFASIDDDGVRLVFWYDGDLFDAVDPEQVPTGLRAFVVYEIMDKAKRKNYMPTSGYNRISFLFPFKEMLKAL